MFDLGLTQSKYVPQPFFKKKNGKLLLVVAKIVDDLKVAGVEYNAKLFLDEFNKKI